MTYYQGHYRTRTYHLLYKFKNNDTISQKLLPLQNYRTAIAFTKNFKVFLNNVFKNLYYYFFHVYNYIHSKFMKKLNEVKFID